MKKVVATILSALWMVGALAQGTVWFSNLNPDHGVDAPVFFLASTNRVAGPNYLAQLYAGLTPETLVAVGSPAPFYSGSAAGYFMGGAITIPFVAPGGTVYCEVHAWDTTLGGTTTGATEAQAFDYSLLGYSVWGSSYFGVTCFDPVRPPFPVVTGNPFATPPGLPAPLIGLQSFTLGVPVPEPSAPALVLLGALIALGRRIRAQARRESSQVQDWQGKLMRQLVAHPAGYQAREGAARPSFRWLLSVVLLALPTALQAQFTYITNHGAITITGYTGPGGEVTIPKTINGLTVSSIGNAAFSHCTNVTSVTLPDSLTLIGTSAFHYCDSLSDIAIPDSVSTIGSAAFSSCDSLTGIRLPNSLSAIEGWTFDLCASLTNITVGNRLTNIGPWAFFSCNNLTSIQFAGDAPSADEGAFMGANPTIYYLPGSSGWGETLGGQPTALWYPLLQTGAPGLGFGTNGFGFRVTWATDQSVAAEACTNLANPTWVPLRTNVLIGGSVYFRDPAATNYSARFYRVRQIPPPPAIQNPGFESAIFVPVPTGYAGSVDPGAALPGWTAFWGTEPAGFVLHDAKFLDSAGVSILDTTNCVNYPPIPPCPPAAFEGQFTVLLQGGFSAWSYPRVLSSALAQTVLIPYSAKTLLFDAYCVDYVGNIEPDFVVTVTGQNVPFYSLVTHTRFACYGIDISPFAGQMQEIRFTAFPHSPPRLPINNVYLDNIRFSNDPILTMRGSVDVH